MTKRILLAVWVVLLLCALPAWATLTVDSQMPSQAGQASAGGATSLTYSFTNSAGTLLVVCADIGSGFGGSGTITGITYNGVSMTSSVTRRNGNNADAQVGLFYLLNPATGAHNVVVSATNTDANGIIISGAISFTGNDTSTPIKQSTAADDGGVNGTTASVNVTSTTSGNIVVDCANNGTSMGTSSNTLTWKKNADAGDFGNNAASSYASSSGGTVTMKYTGNGNDSRAIVAVEVAAAAGGGPVPHFNKRKKLAKYAEEQT